MNHADLKATHTFGDDQKVRPKTSTAALTGGRFTFPAHSLTILRLKTKDTKDGEETEGAR
jgi:hypothetical protein